MLWLRVCNGSLSVVVRVPLMVAVSDGVATAVWDRPMRTGDEEHDNVISLGGEQVASFAWNPTTAFPPGPPTDATRTSPYHGPDHRLANVVIDFRTGRATVAFSLVTTLKVLHGVMMGTIWLVNACVAVFVARCVGERCRDARLPGTGPTVDWFVGLIACLHVAAVGRYKRHVRGWIHTHQVLMGLGTFITWPNYLVALTYTNDVVSSPHAILGM